MLRSRLVTAVTLAVGLALTGCSSAPSWMPSWMSATPPPPPTQALQFESEPPGASVQTTQGQTCRTPCSLTVPVNSQSISFSMNGYTPQTIPLTVNQPDQSMFDHPPPVLVPNPVMASLQPLPKPVARPKPNHPRVAAKPAVRPARPPAAAQQPSIMAPEQTPTQQDNSFPPPPSQSPFPPPPTR
jgi:hypothetical protein